MVPIFYAFLMIAGPLAWSQDLPIAHEGSHPWVEALPHRMVNEKAIPEAQRSIESQVLKAVFEVELQSTEGTDGREVYATAFQVAPNIVLTNRHVLEGLFGNDFMKKSPSGNTLSRVRFYSSTAEIGFRASQILHCSPDVDYCFLKLAPRSDGRAAGDLLPILRLIRSPETLFKKKGTIIGVIGNMNAEGTQISSGKLVSGFSTGLILHCAPTSSHESGGNSGSPIFEQQGNVIGMDTYSLMLNSNCKFRGKTTGAGISMGAILRDFEEKRPDLIQDLNLF